MKTHSWSGTCSCYSCFMNTYNNNNRKCTLNSMKSVKISVCVSFYKFGKCKWIYCRYASIIKIVFSVEQLPIIRSNWVRKQYRLYARNSYNRTSAMTSFLLFFFSKYFISLCKQNPIDTNHDVLLLLKYETNSTKERGKKKLFVSDIGISFVCADKMRVRRGACYRF